MRRIHTLACLLLTLVMAAAVGCGGGGSGSPIVIPKGTFSNSNLLGFYSFSVSGVDANGFFAAAGFFQLNGSGTITTGVADINSGAGVFTNVPIAGTYKVTPDGRGSATITSAVENFSLAFVLTANGHALVTRFEPGATASGSIDQQTTSAFSTAALNAGFGLNLSGIDAAGNIFTIAGAITMDGAGNISGGVLDANDNGAVSVNLPVTGTYNVANNGRGTAAITTSLGTLNFAFYVVDSTHIKMVETDGVPVLSGDAFKQQGPFTNAALSGSFAFTVGGSSIQGPFVAGGTIKADGAGNITAGSEDFNNNGLSTQNVALTGTYAMAASGRGTLTLSSSLGSATFVFYPTTGGIQVMQTDAAFVTSGSALLQQASFSNATLQGGYGMNMNGVDLGAGAEVDQTAQFTADGAGNTTGILDVNDGGSLSPGLSLKSTYSITSGRGTMALQSNFGPQSLVVYPVDSTRALFIDLDSDLVGVGIIQHQ